jgi:hypothetical protein
METQSKLNTDTIRKTLLKGESFLFTAANVGFKIIFQRTAFNPFSSEKKNIVKTSIPWYFKATPQQYVFNSVFHEWAPPTVH